MYTPGRGGSRVKRQRSERSSGFHTAVARVRGPGIELLKHSRQQVALRLREGCAGMPPDHVASTLLDRPYRSGITRCPDGVDVQRVGVAPHLAEADSEREAIVNEPAGHQGTGGEERSGGGLVPAKYLLVSLHVEEEPIA